MRITTQRDQFAWLLADVSIQPNARPPGMPGAGNQPVLPKPQAQQARDEPWMANDWRNATDGGAFHSSVRPPMSSDIPHPSEVLDPTNKRHTEPRKIKVTNPRTKEALVYHLPSWMDQAVNSKDPENDPWGVATDPHLVEHHSAPGKPENVVTDVTDEHRVNSPEKLVQHNKAHHDNMTPDEEYKGRVWYRAAHEGTKDLSDKTIGDHERVVHTMSAYSPKTEWDENLEKGHHFITHYDPRGVGPVGEGGESQTSTPVIPGLQSPMRKAIDIYHAHPDDVAKVNSGAKTSSFANNILDATPMREPRADVEDDSGYYQHDINPHTGEPDWRMHPDQDSTIDTHAVRLMNTPHGDPEALRRLKYATPPHFEAGLTVNGKEINPGYDLYARQNWETTRRVNAERDDPHKHLIPKQVQAGPWGKFKNDLNVAKGKTETDVGERPKGLQDYLDRPKNRGRDPRELEQEWAAKSPLTDALPRYQKDRGDFWTDPERRPEINLRETPGWGRRSMRLASTGSPVFDRWLGDYIDRHPQHDVSPHLASYFPLAHSESLHRVSPSGEEESYVHSINADTMPPMECPECGLPFDPRELDEHHFLNHGGDLGQVSDQELLGTPWGLGERDMPMHRLNSVQDTLDYVDRLLGR